MTGMLASVQNLEEAQFILNYGADIVDLKAPASGALGALPLDQVRQIIARIDHAVPVSATVGDLPLEPRTVYHAVMAMAETGVDYIKVGFFPDGDKAKTLAFLKDNPLLNTRLIAVFFADDPFDPSAIAAVSNAGFSGVMLDTRDKSQGRLTDLLDAEQLRLFVNEARRHHLLCGLAGSLTIQDIAILLPLSPDYLGFRGALCKDHSRTQNLHPNVVSKLKEAMRPTPFSRRAS